MPGGRVPDAGGIERIEMPDVQLTIDGLAVAVPQGTTVFDAARMNGADGVQSFDLCRSQIPANCAQIVAQLLFISRADDQR